MKEKVKTPRGTFLIAQSGKFLQKYQGSINQNKRERLWRKHFTAWYW